METKELTGAYLNYWVAQAEGLKVQIGPDKGCVYLVGSCFYAPSGNWEQGGPIIEREKIDLMHIRRFKSWTARANQRGREAPPITARGESALIAAMRCYVHSKYGDEVPDIT